MLKTFKQYVESKQSSEQAEEESGLDFDHDKEKGESPAHAAKVRKKKEENLEFFNKRKDGANKIANQAKTKGGASILTYWHFAAKAQPYREVIRAIKEDRPESYFKHKFTNAMSATHTHLTQQKFQRAMGVLEVWGEAMAQLFKRT